MGLFLHQAFYILLLHPLLIALCHASPALGRQSDLDIQPAGSASDIPSSTEKYILNRRDTPSAHNLQPFWPLQMLSSRTKLTFPLPIPLRKQRRPPVRPRSSGAGVTVYILDSGLNISHPGFQGRARWFGSGADWSNFVQHAAMDYEGHGTQVAGVVADRYVGVAPGATVVGVKVKCGRAEPVVNGRRCREDGAEGVVSALAAVVKQHVMDRQKAAAAKAAGRPSGWRGSVINISMVFMDRPENRKILRQVRKAREEGIPVVVSAPNRKDPDVWDQILCKEKSPAFCVGPCDREYRYDINFPGAPDVDIVAPGVEVPTITAGDPTGFVQVDGSSIAAPFVTGVMATIIGDSDRLNRNEADVAFVEKYIKDHAVSGLVTSPVMNVPKLFLQLYQPS